MAEQRVNILSGTQWETQIAYSRAVRIGNIIEVAGTTAVDQDGNTMGVDDPYEQTRFILQKIEHALNRAGGSKYDITRTRIYTTDISRWSEIGRAHQEYFHNINPASTMVEVKALIQPDLLVEVEVSAVLLP